MSIINDILGRGAIDPRFTDWDSARDFVIFQAIIPNPRLSDEVKVKLQQIEQQAYDENAGKWTLSEKEEIGRYYNYLKNQFPSVTDDSRFLAIFEVADQVKASEPAVGIEDIEVPSPVKWGAVYIALGAIGFLYLTSKD